MKKFWAIACTLGFSAFWVFGGLSVLAFIDGHPLFGAVLVLALLGLGAGIWARVRLVALTQELARGERVTQEETAHA
ncbi:hypothetical protein SAMN05421774_102723 [Gemmobacter megaterium]|uniref:Uncharacterized protein n=1 Tax=Gemmobacter megaterium TaxID=1086013 RepID=A0A1N7MIN3_9RHOB|nr:hypothetical protein [Gemmobacter megaterium]GGE06539.1 hypothetical protein GCM10011345_10140 [Gemmobacter megaterium]SIS86044.1 hypothetical protein SAMN05421774_102723 [Gemmobacter megaterium]